MSIRFRGSCFILSTLLLISAAAFQGCAKKQPPKKPSVKSVHVGEAINHQIPVYVNAIGNTKSYYDVDIKSQVTGEVISYHFQEGQYLKKGDLLFKIDPRPYQAVLDQSKAELKIAEATFQLKKYVTKQDQPIATQGIMASQTYAGVVTDLAKGNAEIEFSKAAVQKNQINLDFCTITSPIDGIAGYRKVDPGNIVPGNTGPTLVNIKSIDPLYVDFTIPENNFSLLRESMAKGKLNVIITTDEFNIKEDTIKKYHLGHLEMVDNYINTNTGMIPLRGVVDNKDRAFWPGEYVNVVLIYYIKQDALLVPYQSVQQGIKGYYLFSIDQDKKAHLHWVKQGLRQIDYVEVLPDENDPIKPGEQIVTVGQMGLIDGDSVEILQKDTFQPPTWQYFESLLKQNQDLNKE